MNLLLRVETVTFIFVFFVTLLNSRDLAFNDPGTFWHTRCGQIMIQNQALIQTDPFTFTFENQRWVPQQWLAEIAMAGLYSLAKWEGPLIALATLLGVLYAWIAGRMRDSGMPAVFAFMLVVAGWWCGWFHIFVRPHMITLAMTAWTTAMLVDFDRGKINLRRFAWLIPAFALWTNLHGGVVGGLMMLAIASATWLLLWLFKKQSPVQSFPQAVGLCAVSIACACMPLVNPFGWEMITIWRRIIGSKVMKQYFMEHQPFDISDNASRLVLVVILVYLFYLLTVLFTFGIRSIRITWLIPLLWFALTFTGIRQGPLAIVTTLVLLADLWPLSKIGQSLKVQKLWPADKKAWLLPAVTVVSTFIFFAISKKEIVIHDDLHWPTKALPELKQHLNMLPSRTKIYNDTMFGGYIPWHFPQLKTFTDDRFELIGEEKMQEYCDTVFTNPEHFDDWQKTFQFEYALVETDVKNDKKKTDISPLEKHLLEKPGEWKVLVRHPKAVLFQKLSAK